MQEQLFHIFVGTAYQGPQRARNKHEAVELFAHRMRKSVLIYHAKPANVDVRMLKQPKQEA